MFLQTRFLVKEMSAVGFFYSVSVVWGLHTLLHCPMFLVRQCHLVSAHFATLSYIFQSASITWCWYTMPHCLMFFSLLVSPGVGTLCHVVLCSFSFLMSSGVGALCHIVLCFLASQCHLVSAHCVMLCYVFLASLCHLVLAHCATLFYIFQLPNVIWCQHTAPHCLMFSNLLVPSGVGTLCHVV